MSGMRIALAIWALKRFENIIACAGYSWTTTFLRNGHQLYSGDQTLPDRPQSSLIRGGPSRSKPL